MPSFPKYILLNENWHFHDFGPIHKAILRDFLAQQSTIWKKKYRDFSPASF